MRIIDSETVISAVEQMCIEANCYISDDIKEALKKGKENETSPVAVSVLEDLIENARIARDKTVPVCQDTGMAVFFVEIGSDVHISGMTLNDAINEGVRRGYTNGYLRKSVVSDPLRRVNTNDNTPAVIYCYFV